VQVGIAPALSTLLWINLWLLLWRIAMRALFTGSAYGWREGIRSVPRLIVGNVVAICAAIRALMIYARRSPPAWDKTRHTFPKEISA
jgi:adsorption protein B